MAEINEKVAWYCPNCERKEAPRDQKYCPDCGEKMQRCSRYEWFLCDALFTILDHSGAEFAIIEQYPIMDHRGFEWYFDLCVKILNAAPHSEFKNMLIEIDGDDHKRQKTYSGPGGGYTRDKDKRWEVFSVQRLHKYGWDLRRVTNDQCSKKNVFLTAVDLADEILTRAGIKF